MELLGIPLRGVQRKIKRLKEQGIIERKGGKQYGYWEIKKNEEYTTKMIWRVYQDIFKKISSNDSESHNPLAKPLPAMKSSPGIPIGTGLSLMVISNVF